MSCAFLWIFIFGNKIQKQKSGGINMVRMVIFNHLEQ